MFPAGLLLLAAFLLLPFVMADRISIGCSSHAGGPAESLMLAEQLSVFYFIF